MSTSYAANQPANIELRMTDFDDDLLVSLLAGFDGGVTVEALAVAHARTRAGIEARLVKDGRLEIEQAGAARIR